MEDITKDPEYIKGYQQGMEVWRDEHSLHMRGFRDGYRVLDAQKIVDSTVVDLKQISTCVEGLDERLRKLERYTQE